MFNHRLYTCSKHNYSSVNAPCPDCMDLVVTLTAERDRYKAGLDAAIKEVVKWSTEAGRISAECARLRADLEKVTAERDDALSALNRLRALTTHGGWIDFVLEKTHPQVFNRIQEDGNE